MGSHTVNNEEMQHITAALTMVPGLTQLIRDTLADAAELLPGDQRKTVMLEKIFKVGNALSGIDDQARYALHELGFKPTVLQVEEK